MKLLDHASLRGPAPSRPLPDLSPASRRGAWVVLLAGLLAAVTASATVPVITSTAYKANTIATGVVYALPKKMVLIGFTREKVDYAKLVEAQAKAQAAATEADTASDASDKKVADLTAQVAQATDEKTKSKLGDDLALAQVEQKVAGIEAKKAKGALELATEALQLFSDGQTRDTLTVAVQDAVPDSDYVFVATMGHSKWRTDTFNLKTTDAGLLEGYVGTAADKTGEVVLKAVEAARDLLAIAGGGGPNALGVKPAPTGLPPFKYQRLIDPAKPEDLAAVNGDLADLQAGCHLVVTPGGASLAAAKSNQSSLSGPQPGLIYRRPVQRTLVAYDVSLLPNSGKGATDDQAISGGKYLQSISMLLPNQGPLAVLDLPASRMVSTDFDFAFKDGMLISFKSVRPSEALAWASLIPDALRAIIAIPSDLIQLKVDYSSKDKALADAKKATLDSQVELLKSQQALDAALKAAQASAGTTASTP